MVAQNEILNEWHRMFEELGPEHQMILKQTLNTPSFEILLNLYAREKQELLQNLDITREDTDFKHKYVVVKMQGEFAESLAHFVKTLNT